MKQINKDNIIDAINKYIASTPKHPLLVWFHSNIDIDETRRNIANISGCATCGGAIYADKEGVIQPAGADKKVIIPGTYNETTKFFLFHRYLEQLKAPFLQYAVDLMKETKLPVIYVANDYSKEEEPQADVSAFEQWEYIRK